MRKLLTTTILFFCLCYNFSIASDNNTSGKDDREYWTKLAYKISYPLLDALSKQELKAQMPVELNNRMAEPGSYEPTYLEALGRLLCGISPWLELPFDNSEEGKMRKELLELAHKGIHNLVNPKSADYVDFSKPYQPLVDAAFLAQAFLRSPKHLWGMLDEQTQQMVLNSLYSTRSTKPWYNNWLLFSATIEAFFLSIDKPWDSMRVDYAIKKHEDWYRGDGTYSDGEDFHWDYYNSYVIQPMMLDIHKVLFSKEKCKEENLRTIEKRATRYAQVQERLISPEGTFPIIGRSICYRTGAFQTLGQMALLHKLPNNISPAQVRCALTAITKRCFEQPKTFDKNGWLTLGLIGHQPSLAENYISTGSLYLTAVGFLPLGLPASDSFWSSPAEDWTSVKAWNGESIPIDKALKD